MESIEYYQNIAKEDIKRDENKAVLYSEIDDMVEANFELPTTLKNLSFLKERKFVSLAPRNATMASIRAFATLMPSIDIEPTNNDDAEYQRVERMETALEWHYKLLNMGREQSPHWKIIESAVKYCNVALQVNYVPFDKKKQKGKRSKTIKQRGDFSFTVHHPSNVHPRYSDDGLECVTLAQTRTVQSVIDIWGKENTGVKQLIADTDGDKLTKAADRLTTEVNYYDYTDIENRVVWCTFSDMSNATSEQGDAYILCMKKHKMPFINWAIKDNREPILKGVFSTWQTANIVKTIIYASHIETAGKPKYWVKTLSANDDVEINFDDVGNPLKLIQGQEVGVLPPAPVDPQLAKTEADLDSQIYQSTAASILNSVERMVGSNISFSSMNAALQAAMGQLGLAKMTAEQVLQEAFLLVMRWIDYSGEPLTAYRAENKNMDGAEFQRGQQIALMPNAELAPDEVSDPNIIYFDPDHIYINVKLNANTISDEQGRITNEINKVERLGFSQQSAYEKIGGMDFEREQGQKMSETLMQHELNMKIQKDQMMLQLEIEQKKMEMQMQAQQAQMQQQMAQQQAMQQQAMQQQTANQQTNQAGAFEGAQGMDTRGGGQAPQGSAPQMTREAINQADANGVPLA